MGVVIVEKKLHPTLRAFIPVVKGVAETFGKNCEVVLHDFSDMEHSIVAIANGHVTGRSLGSPMTEASLKKVLRDKTKKDIINYSEKSADGRILKSTTIFIRDEKEKVLGSYCINYDITELIIAKSVFNDIITIKDDASEESQQSDVNLVSGVLADIVKETIETFGKPIIYLTKDEKVAVVKDLENKGAFLIKGAIDYVADVLCVSRYTIYNYLDEVRK